MKLYNNGYRITDAFFKNQKLKIGKKYHLSNFVYSKIIDDEAYLFNSLTGVLLSLEKNEFELVNKELTFNDDKNIDLLQQLVDTHTLVEKTEDEVSTLNSIKSLLKTFNNIQPFQKYTILTTTHCNAHCFYCFEHCLGKESMDEKTAKDVVEFIVRTMSSKKIVLQWFGGEPLYNQDVINYICTELKSRNVEFSSRITTNGYLFDTNEIDRYIKLWNLESATITLDGTEEEHNSRKNFDKKCINPFNKIIQNIKFLSDNKVSVNIRINYDSNNFNDCKDLIMYLKNYLSDKKYIRINPTLLYGEREKSGNDWLNMEIELMVKEQL